MLNFKLQKIQPSTFIFDEKILITKINEKKKRLSKNFQFLNIQIFGNFTFFSFFMSVFISHLLLGWRQARYFNRKYQICVTLYLSLSVSIAHSSSLPPLNWFLLSLRRIQNWNKFFIIFHIKIVRRTDGRIINSNRQSIDNLLNKISPFEFKFKFEFLFRKWNYRSRFSTVEIKS